MHRLPNKNAETIEAAAFFFISIESILPYLDGEATKCAYIVRHWVELSERGLFFFFTKWPDWKREAMQVAFIFDVLNVHCEQCARTQVYHYIHSG